jgi:hypothetical protein
LSQGVEGVEGVGGVDGDEGVEDVAGVAAGPRGTLDPGRPDPSGEGSRRMLERDITDGLTKAGMGKVVAVAARYTHSSRWWNSKSSAAKWGARLE